MFLFNKDKVKDKTLNFNIATIGHVDHGKTTLTAAITITLSIINNPAYTAEENAYLRSSNKFVEYNKIDKTKEEQVRGITIQASHIEYASLKRHYSHTDCPGHLDFIKNTITGLNSADGAILLVAASEGVKPQTKEHSLLAIQTGIKNIVVVLNKIDIVGDTKEEIIEIFELIKGEILDILQEINWPNIENVQFVPIAATKALHKVEDDFAQPIVIKLIDIIDSFPAPVRDGEKPFIVPVEDAFIKPGRGLIVTGKLSQGKLNREDPLEVITQEGKIIPAVVKDIEVFYTAIEKAEAGDNIGMYIKGSKGINLSREIITKGTILAAVGYVKPAIKFLIQTILYPAKFGGRAKPFKKNYEPSFCYGPAYITGSITNIFIQTEEGLIQQDQAQPGNVYVLEVTLYKAIGVPFEDGKRQPVKLSLRGDSKSIGSGIIIEYLDDIDKTKSL